MPADIRLTSRPLVERIRRVLLAAATALLVARPLVLGEDPGLLLSSLSGSAGLALTLLWLWFLVGTAGWRALTGKGRPLGAIGWGLATVSALVWLSVIWAEYKHPARLVAWEWVAFAAAFAVLRWLPVGDAENRRLLAVLLSGAVSISAYAVYQAAVELPHLRDELRPDSGRLQTELARQGVVLRADDPRVRTWQERVQSNNVFGTFAHPNTFAGYLALMTPSAVGLALTSLRRAPRSPAAWVAAAGAAVVVAALALTHSRGAIIATLGAATVAAILLAGRFPKFRVAALSAILAGLVLGATVPGGEGADGVERAQHSFALRLGYWQATLRMLTDDTMRIIVGVGPGNFGRYYPRYISGSAPEKISDPHNFLLEILATSGVFTLAALVVTLIALFLRTARAWRTPAPLTPTSDDARAAFYIGGVAGFVLAFASQVRDDPATLFAWQPALGRAAVWLICFTVTEGLPWITGVRLLSLVLGVGALLVNFMVSGGISFPSLALLFWAMIALACNLSERSAEATVRRTGLGVLLIAPLALLAVLNLLGVFLPLTAAADALNQAREGGYRWRAGPSRWGSAPPTDYLASQVITPLRRAAELDPSNASTWKELATWCTERWALSGAAADRQAANEAIDNAVYLDRRGKEGHLARYRLECVAANLLPAERKEHFARAARAMQRITVLDPTEARWYLERAQAENGAGNGWVACGQAERALECDRLAPPSRKLTPAERQAARQLMHSR